MFGVFLDARYGRGRDEEFLRLQREIFAAGTLGGAMLDESLFAWRADAIQSSGLLAPAPGCFSDSGHVLFIPSLAKSREAPQNSPNLVNEAGISMDAQGNIDLYIPWRANKHPKTIPLLLCFGHLATFGVGTFLYLISHSIHRRSKKEHFVNLNAWTQGVGGQLHTVRIKVIQNKNKTWRRAECGTFFNGKDDHLYSQSDVHGKAGRATFPHEVFFKGAEMPSRNVKPVKSKARAANMDATRDAMARSPGGWMAPPPPRRM